MQTLVDVPHFGETLLYTVVCADCGFKKSDVLSLTQKPAKSYTFHVKGTAHFGVRVVKSSNATIKIPEFLFESFPGPEAQGFIGNIESLIEQVEATVKSLKVWTKNNIKKSQKLVRLETQLRKARKGVLPFTVILEDPSGNSAILPDPPDTVEIAYLPLPNSNSEEKRVT